MIATKLFQKIENLIPLEMALKDDEVGFLGPGNPEEIFVEKVLILMDFLPQNELKYSKTQYEEYSKINYDNYDLLITHHPPTFKSEVFESEIPIYVIHSNWDIINGGACDALADILDIETNRALDPETGVGRIGIPKKGFISMVEFETLVKEKLGVKFIRTLKTSEFIRNPDKKVNKIAVVSGFGLNPSFIKKAYHSGVDVYISGDLIHPGAILAKNLGINLIDATHYATEIPGLFRLKELFEEVFSASNIKFDLYDTGIPWIDKP